MNTCLAESRTFDPHGKTLIRRGVRKSSAAVSKAFQESFKHL
jgi:hypothetical protein